MVSEATPLDWLTQAFAADSEVPLEVALVRLAAALALGCGVALVCRLGKGGGLSDLFGGGVSSSIGGSSVAEKNLDRLTIGIGLVWAACIVAVGLLVRTG